MQPDPLQAIRDRHDQAVTVTYEVEGHRHGERGCRCLSCDVTTGYVIGTGATCDEHPDASKASDGGCLEYVLTYEQATALVAAHEDRGLLLAEIRRLEALVAAHQRVEQRLIKESMPAWPLRTPRRRREKAQEAVEAEQRETPAQLGYLVAPGDWPGGQPSLSADEAETVLDRLDRLDEGATE